MTPKSGSVLFLSSSKELQNKDGLWGPKSLQILKILYFPTTQLPGRLFSPSDISKKLSHHFLLHFPIGMGSYDHHAKYQSLFPELL